MFGQFSYLVYMLIFTLIPIAIIWGINFRFLWKNKKVPTYSVLVFIIYSIIVDPVAIKWNTWFFSDNKILGIKFLGFPIEDLIFATLISFTIASATLTFINFRESGKFKKIKNKLRL